MTKTLRVSLNGTDTNPYHALGLDQNPFPQLGKTELGKDELRLNSLGGTPIPQATADYYIRERLSGFSQEFIDLCLEQYKPGKYVTFEVTWREYTAA